MSSQPPSVDLERLIGRLVIEHEMTKAIARANEAALRAEIARLQPIDKSTDPEPQSETAASKKPRAGD